MSKWTISIGFFGLVLGIVWLGLRVEQRFACKGPKLVVVPPLSVIPSPVKPSPEPPEKRSPEYIKFYDLDVGEIFEYNGKEYQKLTSSYWTQPANPPINGNLWYPPGTFAPKPVQNAREIKTGFPVHFEADTMVIWVIW